MSATYSEFVDDVLPALKADPSQPVVLHAIKRAVIEFCAGSWVWRTFPDPTNVIAGLAEYDLDIPTGADVTTLFDVIVNNVPLKARSSSWLDTNIPGWRTTRADPKYYTQLDTERVILAPVPDVNVNLGLAMTFVLQPSQAATTFPRWIANQFFYALADGAIGRLMTMPNRPWTDSEGQVRLARYQAAIDNARTTGVAALNRAPVRVSYQH